MSCDKVVAKVSLNQVRVLLDTRKSQLVLQGAVAFDTRLTKGRSYTCRQHAPLFTYRLCLRKSTEEFVMGEKEGERRMPFGR